MSQSGGWASARSATAKPQKAKVGQSVEIAWQNFEPAPVKIDVTQPSGATETLEGSGPSGTVSTTPPVAGQYYVGVAQQDPNNPNVTFAATTDFTAR